MLDLAPLIQDLAQKFPLIVALLAGMGICRLVLKPLFAIFHAVVEATSTPKDNEILAKIEASPITKGVLFVLDWMFSAKLIK